MPKNNKLLRYTNLPVLLDVLIKQELPFLNPVLWDDRNDSYYIELYKQKMELKTVLALCFSTKAETYHHWKVFSDGFSGTCIRFNKEKLLKHLKPKRSFIYQEVEYPLIQELKAQPPELEELPFLKRHQFEDENEFRIIYSHKSKEMETKSLSINLSCIDEIILSPWIPRSIAVTIKDLIADIPGCSFIDVRKSALVDSRVWKRIATKKHGITNQSSSPTKSVGWD